MGSAATPFNGLSHGSPVLDVKLEGSKYREWAFSHKMLLKYGGSASHFTDAPPAATATNEKEIKAWRLTDDCVMAIICMKKCGITYKVATNKAVQPLAIHFVRIFTIFSSRTCQHSSTMLPLTRYQVKLLPWLYWEIYLLEKVGYLS
jgi:hypothetical protein